MSVKDFPRRNDLVIGVVKRVEEHGVTIELLEYDGLEAYIPRGHVASGRIKDIRDYVKEGDTVVGRVIRSIRRKGQVDVSLRYVTEEQKRRKLEEWKERVRVISLLRVAAQRAGYKDPERKAKEAWNKLASYYKNPMDALEDVVHEGPDVLISAGIEGSYAKVIADIVRTQLKTPIYIKNIVLRVVSPEPNGVEVVKNALLSGKGAFKSEKVEIDIYTAGAPRYVVSIRSKDPKLIKRASTLILKAISKALGQKGVMEIMEEREYRKRVE